MMAEITHEHLQTLATRIEESARREGSQLRADVAADFRAVHARIGEVRDQVKEQNNRLRKTEMAIGGLKTAIAVLRATRRSDGTPATEMSRTKLVALAGAVLIALAGLIEVAHELGRVLLAAVKP